MVKEHILRLLLGTQSLGYIVQGLSARCMDSHWYMPEIPSSSHRVIGSAFSGDFWG